MLKKYMDTYVDIKTTLANRQFKISFNERIGFHKDQYDFLVVMFDNAEESPDKKKTEQWVTKECTNYLMPTLEKLLDDPRLSENDKKFAYTIWEKAFALASRRSFHHFMLYIEMDKKPDKQIYANRIEVLRGMTYYLTKMDNEIDFLTLVASFPPSYGKSFIVNYFSAWKFGHSMENTILRLSYSEDLLKQVSNQIKGVILEERFRQVFPQFAKYGDKPFEITQSMNWKFWNTNVGANHISRTRDGSVTGVRTNSYLIFDDMTKGVAEAYQDHVHEEYWQQYTSEWRNRKTSDTDKEIIVGTMWSPKDILGMKQAQMVKQYREEEGRFRYCYEYYDENDKLVAVVIKMPLLDENNMSTCEAIYKTKTALEIKEDSDEYLFSCVYQQNPIAQAGRAFAYENLRTYGFYGSEILHNSKEITLNDYAYASLDPVRKGRDNISMPIFKVDSENPDDHYLIDVIYRGKSMEEIYDVIVDKIINHSICKFVIENNTDTSLKRLLLDRLKQKNYLLCEIIEKFNVKPKFNRIKDMGYAMTTQIVYPERNLFPPNSDMGKFMQALTTYSYEVANKNDDAPDSVALYVADIVKQGSKRARVEAIKRPDYL